MKIENATLGDCSEILALQKKAYISEAVLYRDFNIPPLLQTLESIEEEFRKGIMLKCVEEDFIIGSVRAFRVETTCFIGKLIVDDLFQNKGIGKKLMQEIEMMFPDANRFELFTGHKSLKNISLYQKIGYNIFDQKEINEHLTLVFLEKIVR
jgi:GNAT superfamily N-acetyltransferase